MLKLIIIVLCSSYYSLYLLRLRERLQSIVMTDEYVFVSVCLSACEDISGTTRVIFIPFLCMLLILAARSCSGVVIIRYVLPVLWMTLCFFLQWAI